MNYFTKNLKFLTKAKINQNQLSHLMNITRQSITSLLKTNEPRASTLIKISDIYNVSIDDLLRKDLEIELTEDKQ